MRQGVKQNGGLCEVMQNVRLNIEMQILLFFNVYCFVHILLPV
jgi:hypothetical protein